MGLLSKANSLEQPVISNGLAFSNLITKYSINFFALFEKQDENFANTAEGKRRAKLTTEQIEEVYSTFNLQEP